MSLSLILQVESKFNTTAHYPDSVNFSQGDDDFCLTDGTLYAVCDNQLLGKGTKVKTMKQIEKFIALRAE